MKSLKIKIKLNYNQQIIVETLSNEHRLMYNYLLAYLKNNSLDFKKLNDLYKNIRNQQKLTINSKSAQNTCISLINSIKSYLSLKKTDKTAKFPYKFKSYKYFTSFMYDYNNGNGGFKLLDNNLIINLLSSSKSAKKLIINLPEVCKIISDKNIRTIIIKKEKTDYYICFTYSTPMNIIENNDNFLSIDPGLKNIVTGFSNNGEYIKIKNKTFKSKEKQIEKCQSIMDKKDKGSKNYIKLKERYNKLTKRLSDSNKDFQHKVSKSVVDYCIKCNISNIIYGDIQTKELTKSIKANNRLNKSTQNRGTLSRYKTFLGYKAKNAGIGFYLQNESYTTITNCITQELMKHITLDIREIQLLEDLFIDRDLNGAINIGIKAKVAWFSQINLEEYLRKLNRIYLNY